MRQSNLFTKTQKEAPKDELSRSAILLQKAGFLDKLHAGVYTFLPLGFLVLKRIEKIIRDEMLALGSQEILMPALHPKKLWEQTKRWETMDDLYKLKDASGREFALGPTHEEVVVPLVKKFVSSYKDLPFSVFQIQNKFRMELRAKSGVIRAREFIMKDLYSFHRDENDLNQFYEMMKDVYKRIFDRVGIGNITYLVFASGGSFSKFSHEFQTLSDVGEDTIYLCRKCKVGINKEIINQQKVCPECGSDNLDQERSIEVGNIFSLKTKFSDPFDLKFKDKDGIQKPVLMGCYGIGLGRLMGVIVETNSDENGIIWPESVSPFDVHLVLLGKDDKLKKKAEEAYSALQSRGVLVLYDDREDLSFSEKLKDSDLIGIPKRVVVSEKSINKGGFEVKIRSKKESSFIQEDKLFDFIYGG